MLAYCEPESYATGFHQYPSSVCSQAIGVALTSRTSPASYGIHLQTPSVCEAAS